MCDYSLEMYGSRPARESERYVTTRFPSGSVGLTSPGDCGTAVCVQYDTELTLASISREVQVLAGIGPVTEATFVPLAHGAYRDGVRFENGKCASLQQLGTGVEVLIKAELTLSERLTKRLALV